MAMGGNTQGVGLAHLARVPKPCPQTSCVWVGDQNDPNNAFPSRPRTSPSVATHRSTSFDANQFLKFDACVRVLLDNVRARYTSAPDRSCTPPATDKTRMRCHVHAGGAFAQAGGRSSTKELETEGAIELMSNT